MTGRKQKPPADRSWVQTECVCCQQPEHVSPLRRLVRRLTGKRASS